MYLRICIFVFIKEIPHDDDGGDDKDGRDILKPPQENGMYNPLVGLLWYYTVLYSYDTVKNVLMFT